MVARNGTVLSFTFSFPSSLPPPPLSFTLMVLSLCTLSKGQCQVLSASVYGLMGVVSPSYLKSPGFADMLWFFLQNTQTSAAASLEIMLSFPWKGIGSFYLSRPVLRSWLKM